MARLDRVGDAPPPLSDAAFIGIAGEVVRSIEPISEADPAALLVQFLVAFGSIVGRGPHFRAEADRHGLNLFALIVGDTAKGRKGTSWGHVRTLMRDVDQAWASTALRNGLSSAEGLVSLVRDESPDATIPGLAGVLSRDPRRRALIVESEFASVLTVMKRQGNNLSEVIRNAWDGERLETLTKHLPLVATQAHVSIIGHVTRDELRAKLNDIDTANGFLNRFLLIRSRRVRLLPHGGRLSDETRLGFARRLAEIAGGWTREYEFVRTPEANARWVEVYERLSEGHPGQFGGVTSRAEAQVMRVACLYAALDKSPVIDVCHLEAGLAVWRYAEDSAATIFEGRFGNPLANRILRELRQRAEGMTRSDFHRFLKNHASSEALDEALLILNDFGVARAVEEATTGRPATRWFAN